MSDSNMLEESKIIHGFFVEDKVSEHFSGQGPNGSEDIIEEESEI